MADFDFSFKHPTTIQISGPTLCGKTRLLLEILKEQLVQPFPHRIIWVFSEWQPDYEEARQCYPHIEFIHEWNDEIYKAIRPEDRNLLIIDDQMEEAGNSKSLANLFTKGSHHKNLSIFHLIQNMYHKGGSQRTMSLNSHYNIIFKNPRDATQIRTLAYQMHPGNSKWFLDAFADATSRPYGYLVLDNHPRSDEDQRVLTNILNGNRLTYYTCAKHGINTAAKTCHLHV